MKNLANLFELGNLTVYTRPSVDIDGVSWINEYFWAFTGTTQMNGPYQFIHEAVDAYADVLESFNHDDTKADTVVYVDFAGKKRLTGLA